MIRISDHSFHNTYWTWITARRTVAVSLPSAASQRPARPHWAGRCTPLQMPPLATAPPDTAGPRDVGLAGDGLYAVHVLASDEWARVGVWEGIGSTAALADPAAVEGVLRTGATLIETLEADGFLPRWLQSLQSAARAVPESLLARLGARHGDRIVSETRHAFCTSDRGPVYYRRVTACLFPGGDPLPKG